MSGLAGLFNVPGDEDERNVWSFTHLANHRDIARTIYETTGITLPEYALDPLPINDAHAWLYQHQQIHNDIALVLGTSNLNMLNIDWKNHSSVASFIQANGTLHREICDSLGIA